jgi:hypothetical protein
VTANQILTSTGLILALTVGSQVLASRLCIPAIIVLLSAGFVAGTDHQGLKRERPTVCASDSGVSHGVGTHPSKQIVNAWRACFHPELRIPRWADGIPPGSARSGSGPSERPARHLATSSSTASVTREIRSGETSRSYISAVVSTGLAWSHCGCSLPASSRPATAAPSGTTSQPEPTPSSGAAQKRHPGQLIAGPRPDRTSSADVGRVVVLRRRDQLGTDAPQQSRARSSAVPGPDATSSPAGHAAASAGLLKAALLSHRVLRTGRSIPVGS